MTDKQLSPQYAALEAAYQARKQARVNGLSPQIAALEAAYQAKKAIVNHPSWKQSAKFVLKSIASGIANTLDTVDSFTSPFSNDHTTFKRLANYYAGNPDEEGITGTAANYVKAAAEGSVSPLGGPVANAVGSIGGEWAKQHGYPEWLGNLLGGLAPGAAKHAVEGIADRFASRATKLRSSAIGAGRADYNASKRAKGIQYDINGNPETSLARAINAVHERGGFRGATLLGKEGLRKRNVKTLAKLNDEIANMISSVDNASTTSALVPKYSIAEKWIKTQPLAEQPHLTEALNETKAAHNAGFNGTVGSVQAEKKALYGQTYGETGKAKKALSTYVAADLKNAIENHVDTHAPKLSGKIKEVNQAISDHIQVQNILDKSIPAGESEIPGSMLANWTKTTPSGGAAFVGPELLAQHSGHAGAGLALGAGLNVAMSNSGKFARAGVGDLLSSVVGIPGKALPTLKDSLLPVIGNTLVGNPSVNGPQDSIPLTQLLSEILSAKSASASQDMGITDSMAMNIPKVKTDSQLAPIQSALDKQALYKAVIGQESGDNPNAISKAGARGLMQVMPGTAEDIARDLGIKDYNLADPETNKLFGEHYLDQMLTKFNNDPGLALTAYHSGPGKVQQLLDYTGGKTLDDILAVPHEDGGLGPIGQIYANQVLSRLQGIQDAQPQEEIAPIQIDAAPIQVADAQAPEIRAPSQPTDLGTLVGLAGPNPTFLD